MNFYLIDKNTAWKLAITNQLTQLGYTVTELPNYDFGLHTERPNVATTIILGCGAIHEAERGLIKTAVTQKVPIIVFASFLPMSTMREAFRLGATFVAEKPYNIDTLKKYIEAAVVSTQKRDNYETCT